MSEVKVNKVSPRSGTTVTIGDSGDTINIVGTLQNNGSPLAGDISSVVAGTGLSGGATSGVATLNIEAAQPTITSLGTITGFTSTGIDDNATSTAMTISSGGVVSIGTTSSSGGWSVKVAGSDAPLELARTSGDTIERSHLGMEREGTIVGQFKSDATNLWLEASAGALIINTGGGTERMRIDSSGNVGIGNTAMSSLNSEANNLVVGTGSGSEGITIYTGSSAGHYGSIFFADGTDSNAEKRGQIRYEHNNEIMSFYTNVTERMRIDSAGRVIIPMVGSNPSVLGALSLKVDGGTYVGISMQKSDTDNLGAMRYYNSSGTEVGSIVVTESATSFNTSSDYRLKDNVVEMTNATDRLKQLQPKRFNFIADADKTVDGFLAHEVSSVVPEAISGEKDATETKEKVVVNANGQVIAENIEQADWETGKIADEDGNTQYPTDSTWEATKIVPDYQGIDQSKLVPLLVKTIQELEARITTLENA